MPVAAASHTVGCAPLSNGTRSPAGGPAVCLRPPASRATGGNVPERPALARLGRRSTAIAIAIRGGVTLRPITAEQVDFLAEGAAVLGTGGGGNTYLAGLDLKRVLRQGATLRIAHVDELAPDAFGPLLSGMGAPTVGIERLPTAGRFGRLVEAAGRAMGRAAGFVAVGEIGGANALRPLTGAAEAGLPAVDADPMGRAFPELQMCTYMIGGILPRPLILNDGKGVDATLSDIADAHTAERYARALTWAMGGSAGLVLGVLTAADVRRHGIPGTLSLAERIGAEMARERARKRSTLDGIARVVPAMRHLFEGKVIDVSRRTAAGFARGQVTLEGLDGRRGERIRIDFQNEYLIARPDGEGEPIVTVPDLLVLVEQESGRAVGSEMVRYGLRVHVLGMPAPFELKTAAALAAVGPGAFGYDDAFRPMAGDLLGRKEPQPA